jgi:hypothetical protein
MTATTTTTNPTGDTQTETAASGPVTDSRLGPIAYRPGATPNTPGLVLYAVISISGRLTIVAAAPEDAPVHTLHRRTGIGQMRCCPLGQGITAWASAEVKVDNPASARVAYQLAEPPEYPGYHQFAGPVVFTGTDPDSARPIGLTPGQVLLLRALHARAPRTVTA